MTYETLQLLEREPGAASGRVTAWQCIGCGRMAA